MPKKMSKNTKKIAPKRSLLKDIKRDKWLYIFLIPIMLYFFIFKYVPMFGTIMAFQDFKFSTGFFESKWVGLEHFKRLFTGNNFLIILRNTLLLNAGSLIFGFPIPIILAIFLNEVKSKGFKKISQSIMYLPHFMSWVVLGGILIDMLSPSTGVINTIIKFFGGNPIYFMGKKEWWPAMFIISGIWQGAGWGTIVYLAAITGMGSMMDIGFEQVYVLMNPAVRDVAEVISTYVYRVGIEGAQYSYTTAIGLFQSVISCILVFTTNKIARKINGEGLW